MDELTLDEIKIFLRIDHDADDEYIEMCKNSAKAYILSACGDVDFSESKVRMVECMLIADYYENRTLGGKGSYSQAISSMLLQIQLETEAK